MEKLVQIDNKRKNNEHDLIPIKSLVTYLLVNVVANVTFESYMNHYNMNVCYREFLHTSKDDFMWQKVSLEKFPLHFWLSKEKALVFDSFIKSCKEGEMLRQYLKRDSIK